MPERFEQLARGALEEITPAATVGAYAGEVDEGDGAVSLLFNSAMPGYPDWKWTVSIAHVAGAEPTVLEAELMPSEGALLAPDWVPWSDRLADFKATQAAADGEPDDEAAKSSSAKEDEEDGDDLDEDALDDGEDEGDLDDHILDDDDVLGSDVLHGGDLDGVDIDEPENYDEDEDGGEDGGDGSVEREKPY